ncbi:hypothetical protein ACPA9J_28985 [Pseudomonas aeruginosa]
MVQGDQILLIDEHTGRTMPGRRLSEGLHQAIEAKGSACRSRPRARPWPPPPSRTISACTTLAGTTGTADTGGLRVPPDLGLDGW